MGRVVLPRPSNPDRVSDKNRSFRYLATAFNCPGPGCSKLGKDNPRLVRHLNSEMKVEQLAPDSFRFAYTI